jgi:formate hydrogenlyase subunit 3/multisubunit Na+/H+ antiporter MnhD subunit
VDARTLALNFTLILPFMLAATWWGLGWLVPRLPEKPRDARWAEWLTLTALVLVLGCGIALALLMRHQFERSLLPVGRSDWFEGAPRAPAEHSLSLFSFKFFIFFTVGFRLDWVALSFFVLIAGLFLWAQLAAVMDSGESPADIALLLVNKDLLLVMGATGLTLFSQDVVAQVLLWHLVPLALYTMMKHDPRAAGTRDAQRKWLCAVSMAGVPFLVGVLILCHGAGAGDPALLRPALASTSSGVMLLSGVLMLMGLYVKLGLMPLHRWTLPLLRSTPLRTRLLLMTVLPALDLSIFARLYYGLYPFWGLQEMSAPLTAFGLLAMTWSAAVAWNVKTDAERLEALHVNQLGLTLLGMGVFAVSAIHGSLLHVAVRAASVLALSGLLWTSHRGRFLPVAHAVHKIALFIAAAALVGAPGTAGFLGAGNVFIGLWQFPTIGAKVLMVFTIALTLCAVVPFVRPLLASLPRQREWTNRQSGESSVEGSLNLPWIIVSVLLLLLGLGTSPLNHLAQLLEQALRVRLHF